MTKTEKKEGSYHTVMSCFGVDKWDLAVYVVAGLATEGITSSQFFDYGEYPHDDDRYMRYLTFTTPEAPDFNTLVNSGKALIQFLELSETSRITSQAMGIIAVDSYEPDIGRGLRMVA